MVRERGAGMLSLEISKEDDIHGRVRSQARPAESAVRSLGATAQRLVRAAAKHQGHGEFALRHFNVDSDRKLGRLTRGLRYRLDPPDRRAVESLASPLFEKNDDGGQRCSGWLPRGRLWRGGPYEFRWLRVELLLWLWRVFPAGSGVISGPPQAVTYFVLPDQLLNARGDIAVRARDNDDAKNAMVWL
jgi:hypothetical protein